MLKFGSNNIGKVLFGSNVIGKAYYGNNLVFQVGGGEGYSVTYNLTDVTSSNSSSFITSSYTTTLTPTTDYTIRSVTVTMGGIDITSTAYSNGVITIADVTGAIVITAVATLLPSGYTRLQYILNTNKTYLDTGVYITPDDHFIIEFGVTSTAIKDRWLFGPATPVSGNHRLWANLYRGDTIAVMPRQGTLISSVAYPTQGKIEIKNRIWTFPGESGSYDATNCGNFTSDTSCYLFGRNSSESSAYTDDVWISHFYIEGEFNGYACKSSNNEVGMYDLVSSSFLKSPDNIAFVAGPDY